jgi:glycosyltransferase involved in cell wall biosynthesis
MNPAKLSFLIPAYNSQDTIEDTLSSVRASASASCEPVTVYISNNNSTDQTSERIKAFLNQYDPGLLSITLNTQPANLGCYGNMRFLQEHCQTDWAYILCADDSLHSSSITSIRQVITDMEEDVDLIFFRDDTNHKIRDTVERVNGSSLVVGKRGLILFYLYGCFVGSMSSTCFKLSNKRQHSKPFDATFQMSGDFNFYVDQLLSGSTIYLSDIETTTYRLGSLISAAGYRDCQPFPEEKRIYNKLLQAITRARHEQFLLKLYVHTVSHYMFYRQATKRLFQGSTTAFLLLSANNTGGVYATTFWCLFSFLMIPRPVRQTLRFFYKTWLL